MSNVGFAQRSLDPTALASQVSRHIIGSLVQAISGVVDLRALIELGFPGKVVLSRQARRKEGEKSQTGQGIKEAL